MPGFQWLWDLSQKLRLKTQKETQLWRDVYDSDWRIFYKRVTGLNLLVRNMALLPVWQQIMEMHGETEGKGRRCCHVSGERGTMVAVIYEVNRGERYLGYRPDRSLWLIRCMYEKREKEGDIYNGPLVSDLKNLIDSNGIYKDSGFSRRWWIPLWTHWVWGPYRPSTCSHLVGHIGIAFSTNLAGDFNLEVMRGSV